MHTDKYLHFNSHHPVSAKRAAIRTLFNRTPLPFIRSISTQKISATPPEENQHTRRKRRSNHPYVSGVSEQIGKACEKYNLKVVFKSGPTFRSLLTKVKDPLPKEKLAGVVY